MTIVIVDYGMGNVGSIANMIKKVGGDSIISSDIDMIANAGKLILPGVGSFDSGMSNLNSTGLRDVLNTKVLKDKVPILGICLGMQLMTHSSEEGIEKGLGWVDAETIKFDFNDFDPKPRIPHMGWNTVRQNKNHKIIEGLDMNSSRFYFVHSYFVKCHKEEDVLLTCNYHNDFTAAFQRDNIIGIQFHPEKSHRFGMELFKNFIEL